MEKYKISNDTKSHIDSRTSEDVEQSRENLLQVSTYIKQLNTYIDGGDITLSKHKIYNMTQWLFENFTFNLIYKLEGKVIFRRARKYEKMNIETPYFKCLKELTYISDDRKDIAPLGRMNQAKEPMYYGVISHSDFNKFDTALSEVDAIEYDIVNTLDSELIKDMSTCHIGAFDLFIRGQTIPSYVNDHNREIFQYFIDMCEEKENVYLQESYIAGNAFFADILSRKEHKNLYHVTSALSSFIFEDKDIDSIIYESVQVKGAPSIVIKPTIVDEKLQHTEARSFRVLSSLGYGLYRGEELAVGIVKNNETIDWNTK